jgi:hypothetical protein
MKAHLTGPFDTVLDWLRRDATHNGLNISRWNVCSACAGLFLNVTDA